ncbi:MAG: Glucose-methanol-choline (GMC) oxidoreductase:NAD binding site [uncultured Paraburkholderia sp.]|uniref:GMC family oxidoreductase n=1 Tax=uncultured Paraburkholderia sp. TaxID=1822466 RepID=UPI00259205BD|nr:GMC family oxidoreductase [uncultured Paraburkholderia sp.]CAH2900167.1 MAG: Glucose-methanol-choline (GMC) oxidoreductase:NAD binding site [uncultured Paraburkholderia sp.]CAH2928034.1 MAG: Glucose-methanol-choline (GMC) oxidoreductase:NAD binding site [uncultured Paraburkholderia sp.]
MKEVADIVIIGSGASGAAAAWSLSRDRSLRIVCLEQGSVTKPSDYPSTSVDWELSRSGAYSSNPSVRRSAADYPIDDSASPISIANFNGFGGSTILYSAHFPRFHPSDFRTRTLDGVGDDWPLSFEELKPFFTENERMMGVAGLVGDPANPDYESLLPPIPLGPMGRTMAAAFNELGWHWWPSYSAINTHRHGNRGACVNLGPCNTGCAQGAKASVDVTYWPVARQQGVEVRTQCRVREITLDARGQADGVLYMDADGVEHRLNARVVVVACSGVGTPRLLLNSRSSAFPDGLLNDNGLVGRNLMLHPLAYTEAVFDHDVQSSIGPHGCCILSQQFYESAAERDFVRGYTMQVLRGAPPVETAVSGYFMRQVPLGAEHHAKFNRLFNRTAGIAIITEDLPEPENRVELDPDHCDSSGMPGVKVFYKLGDNTSRMLKHGIEMSKQVFSAAGAKVTSSFAPVKNTGWHLMGTARMGDDPATSVVNKFGQAHAVKNLFIVDSSIFVTAGAVNPVATAQALTLMACDHLQRNLHTLVA